MKTLLKITWENGMTQVRELVNYCKADKEHQTFITMQSTIYEAIVNETYFIDLGYGKHYFKVEEITPTGC